MTGGFDGFVQSKAGGDYKALEAAVQALVAAASQRPELAGVTTSYSASVPQIRIDLDREKAKLLGVNVAEVFDTLQSTFGALYVNDFNRAGRVFRVHLQSEAEFRAQRRRHPRRVRAHRQRRDDPAHDAGDHPRGHGPRGHRALQRVPLGQGPRRPRARLQLGPGARRHGGGGRARRCPTATRSPGPAPRSRRRPPAAPRARCSWSAC